MDSTIHLESRISSISPASVTAVKVLWPVCVRPGQTPRSLVFLCRLSNEIEIHDNHLVFMAVIEISEH